MEADKPGDYFTAPQTKAKCPLMAATLSNQWGPLVTPSVEALHAKLANTFRSHLLYPVEAMAYLDDWPRPIADFEFWDDSALARVSKLRNLSLLTLAEIGRNQWGQTRLIDQIAALTVLRINRV